jgi:AraC family transcriptional regulator
MQGVGENPMSVLENLQVFKALNSSPNARLELSAELGDGLSAALWSNHHDAQDYQAPSHHTLSCYVAGGTGTFRRNQPGTKGGPDKLCILPAEHQSAWVINGEIRLAHVYFSPEQFALGCVTLLDREPRALQLRRKHLSGRRTASAAFSSTDPPQLAGTGRTLADQQPGL